MNRSCLASPRTRAGTPTLLIVALLALPSIAAAIPSAKFELTNHGELKKGRPLGTLISSRGEVIAGFGQRKLSAPQALMFWSKAQGADGTLYLGAGQPGKIIAIKGETSREVADLKTVLVSALALGPGGKLLAATMPGPRLLEVDPGNGKWRELTRLPKGHIWDVLYDAKRNRIFIAGGAPGKVYSLPAAGGKAEVYYNPSEEHLLSLALDEKGNLLTGGANKAILYRISAKNRATAIADFQGNELRKILVSADGTIHVAVNIFPAKTGGLPRYDAEKPGEGGTALTLKAPKTQPKFRSTELRAGAKMGKGAVFRIGPQGRITQLLGLAVGYFTDLAADRDGTVWAGEGSTGKVYLLRGSVVTTAFDLDERQVLAIAIGPQGRFLATGDAGAVYKVLDRPQGKAQYLTDVLDAKGVAQWGNVRLRASARLAVDSRSGNTATPDGTWSAWKATGKQPAGLYRPLSPQGRYLQLRITWPKAQGALRSVEAFYRPLNIAPEITELENKWVDARKGQSRPTKIKLSWKVENPDKDPLIYRLFFREEMGTGWRPLNRGRATSKTAFEWDTANVADDVYRVKVVASDERANGLGSALTHTRVSAPIVVDNRKPEAVGLVVRYPFVSGMAKDQTSEISSIEFSVDDGPWRLLDAVDGVYDSSAERFRFSLPKVVRRGTHNLVIRIKDSAGNMGLSKLRFVQ